MKNHLTIVTGSSRGLGAALVAQLINQPGDSVLGIARQQNAKLQAQADATGATLTQWPADLGEPAAVAQNLAAWLTGFDPTTLASVTLINNAGVTGSLGNLEAVPLADISQALRVGLEAAMLLTATFLHATRDWPAQRRVLNISSGLGRSAMAGSAVYCAAKAGMDHFSRAVALEQAAAPHPALISSMAPGVIDTDMQAALRASDPVKFPARERFVAMQTSGALVSPAACAQALLERLNRADFGQAAITDIREG